MHRTIVATVATVVALGLTGCAEDDPAPQFADSASASPTSDPTTPAPSTSSPPPTPDPEPLGPEETVRAWVEARNTLLASGVSNRVYELSDDACTTCADLIDPVSDLYSDGGRVETEGWLASNIKRSPDFDSSQQVLGSFEFASGRTYPDADSAPEAFPPQKNILEFTLVRVQEEWLVQMVAFLS